MKISLIFLFALTVNLNNVKSESFNDVPLKMDIGHWIINATLYDQDNEKRYYINEMIESSESITGKISISSNDYSVDVFYDNQYPNERLVIHDNRCDLFTYKTKWDSKLPGIINPLLNHILLVGPSLTYRMKSRSLNWHEGLIFEIRGIKMSSSYANFGSEKLRLTYYQKYIEGENNEPDRILFYGIDSSDSSISESKVFIMDIYSRTKIDQDISGFVTPTPGIGCPSYLNSGKIMASFYTDQMQYISIERTKGSVISTTKEEIYADRGMGILYSKTSTNLGEITEKLYDHNLGISYIKKNDYCLMNPMDSADPGVSVGYYGNSMNFNTLINENYLRVYKYLGLVSDPQNGFENLYAFETVNYNETTSSGKYDKIVTTIYFASDDGFDYGNTIHSSSINAYNEDSSGGYKLIETIQKNFYHFSLKISDQEYENSFDFDSCYKPNEKKTFVFTFSCSNFCDMTFNRPYFYQNNLKTMLVNSEKIAGSRITNVDTIFSSNEIISYVTLTDFPIIEDALHYKTIFLSRNAIKTQSTVSVKDAKECLELYGEMATTFSAIAYCESKFCSRISSLDDIIEDENDGYFCNIYYVPLKNLYRYNRELRFDSIQSGLSSIGLTMSQYNGNAGMVQYSLMSIDEIKDKTDQNKQLYNIYLSNQKFILDNDKVTVIEGVENFAQCYHECVNSDEDECKTFSICVYADSFECSVSSLDSTNLLTDSTIQFDESCSIYSKNYLLDYNPVENRRYKNSPSISTSNYLSDCASLCSQSDQCFSFQYCAGQCTFADYYSDSTTQYDEFCKIFIPKVEEKFISTGHEVAAETFLTETDLTMEQCSALCFNLNDDNESCRSFNFCPKGKKSSKCNLSKYSTLDSSTATTTALECKNYEYVQTPDVVNQKVNTKNVQQIGTSSVAAFGIIVCFLIGGFLTGFVIPIAYKTTYKKFTNN